MADLPHAPSLPRAAGQAAPPKDELLFAKDRARAGALAERAADWRAGAIVYQVLVDRFAPPADPAAKAAYYESPRRLRGWDEVPKRGKYVKSADVWSQEIEFWGGDLRSLEGRLDWIHGLGADVLYLNPVFEAFTNHKYDATDYRRVDPGYGDHAALRSLADACHARGMRIVLDGVFNHMGRRSPMFQDALARRDSQWRDFFLWKESAPGYVGWSDVANLPELNVDHPRVRDWLYRRPDSVVQSYLRDDGIDGWRLDVAFDLGYARLAELTAAAHAAKPGCLVLGEIYNYPEEWFPAVDGLMNMHGRQLVLRMLEGALDPPRAARMWETMVDDAGIEPVLRSWLVLDNHDTPRLPTYLKRDQALVAIARTLQFTLPGAPNLYYGGELGMTGGADPEMRAPMRWDLAKESNPALALHRRLIALRRAEPALRHGDFRRLDAARCFAFTRRTVRPAETVVVVANPHAEAVREFLPLRESKIQAETPLVDLATGERFTVYTGSVELDIPARSVRVLKPDCAPAPGGYDRYDRLP